MSRGAIFDSNILIDFANGWPAAADTIRRFPERLISVVTWVEFLTGVPEPQIEKAKSFISDMFEVVYPEEEIYDITLTLRRQRRLRLPDAMIYATARSLKMPLITRNTKDFDPAWGDVIVPYEKNI